MFHNRSWETVSGLGDQAERAFAHGDFGTGLSLMGEADTLSADLSHETGDLFADNGQGYFDAPAPTFPLVHRRRR